jgi:hypothetical protein
MSIESSQCRKSFNNLEKMIYWSLCLGLKDVNIIDTKWVFCNKANEFGNITKNKARLVTQGNTQVEDIDINKTFSSVSRLESVILLPVTCAKSFTL